jgi:hypothetical protein
MTFIQTATERTAAGTVAQLYAEDVADLVWVPDTRSTSCDLRVLVDQPTESVPSYDPPSRLGDSCRFAT